MHHTLLPSPAPLSYLIIGWSYVLLSRVGHLAYRLHRPLGPPPRHHTATCIFLQFWQGTCGLSLAHLPVLNKVMCITIDSRTHVAASTCALGLAISRAFHFLTHSPRSLSSSCPAHPSARPHSGVSINGLKLDVLNSLLSPRPKTKVRYHASTRLLPPALCSSAALAALPQVPGVWVSVYLRGVFVLHGRMRVCAAVYVRVV
jgi:hypothetical protein